MLRRSPCSILFPYTTLFRSGLPPELANIARTLLMDLKALGIFLVPVGELEGWITVGTRQKKKWIRPRSEEHTSELQSLRHLVCRLLLEKKNKNTTKTADET